MQRNIALPAARKVNQSSTFRNVAGYVEACDAYSATCLAMLSPSSLRCNLQEKCLVFNRTVNWALMFITWFMKELYLPAKPELQWLCWWCLRKALMCQSLYPHSGIHSSIAVANKQYENARAKFWRCSFSDYIWRTRWVNLLLKCTSILCSYSSKPWLCGIQVLLCFHYLLLFQSLSVTVQRS